MKPTSSDHPNTTAATTDSDDELLSALDQFTDAVHWLRARTRYSAVEAITEAMTEWITEHAEPDEDPQTADRPIGLGDAVSGFRSTINRLVASGTAITAASALTEAITDWTAAATTEHHQSQPFQPPSRPANVVAQTDHR